MCALSAKSTTKRLSMALDPAQLACKAARSYKSVLNAIILKNDIVHR